jgi:hypothetical protein
MAPPYGIALNVEATEPGHPMEKPLAPISPLGSSPGEVQGDTWNGAGAILVWKDERVADVVTSPNELDEPSDQIGAFSTVSTTAWNKKEGGPQCLQPTSRHGQSSTAMTCRSDYRARDPWEVDWTP